MNRKIFFLITLLLVLATTGCLEEKSLILPGAKIEKLATGFKFTEGPAADKEGNVFFTDIPNNRINKWSTDGKLSTFVENSGAANGLFFDKMGNLIACAGGNGQLVSIDPKGKITVVAEKYNGKKFNQPNDLWLDAKGGIYFTDPRYGNRDNLPQDGEHVYYVTPDRKTVIRVVDDFTRPNGIIGSPNGKLLYVADNGAKNSFVYKINKDGTLSDKKLFALAGYDGMTIDSKGNVYMTLRPKKIDVYNPQGDVIETIEFPEQPANVCFGGKDKKTLFVTAQTSLYSLKMNAKGL